MHTLFTLCEAATSQCHASHPYARFIGLNVGFDAAGSRLFALPYQPDNIGNTYLPALHGGVIAGFLQSAALFYIQEQASLFTSAKMVDFSLDYLRSGKPETLLARCEIIRQGSRMSNVAIYAWQEHAAKLIATARAHLEMPAGSVNF